MAVRKITKAQQERNDLRSLREIDAWAHESKVKHRRECTEKICGAKQTIWWNVRHPQAPAGISNPSAIAYLINRVHVCGVMLERLASGDVPWLEGEYEAYAARTDEEIAQMIGRDVFFEEPEAAEEISDNPFPAVMSKFPETKTEIERRSYRAGKADRYERQTNRTRAATGLGATVDSLTANKRGR